MTQEVAVQAARLVADEGLDYGSAKRKAARALGMDRARQMPSNEQVEDEVRTHLALFHADTQPTELLAMRRVALRWMQRVAHLRPYLSRAVWRGTATLASPICIELYADDPKMAQIDLINLGLRDTQNVPGTDVVVLTRKELAVELGASVEITFSVLDADDLRGALKPDARGHAWRGDAVALARLLEVDQVETTVLKPS